MNNALISKMFSISFILSCCGMSFSQNQSNPTAISSNIANQVTMQVTNQFIGNHYTQNVNYPKCQADEVTAGFVQQQILNDPSYLSKVAAQTQLIQQGAQNNSASKKVLRTIPVVVHILYNSSNSNSPDENVPDSYIYDMLNTLNEDYRRLNADASQTRSQFQGVAADVEIEFCLASKDVNGASTTGITRTATTEGYFNPDTETNKMKSDGTNGKTGWDATKYLNIWICNISNYANYGTAGYAYLPTSGMHGSSIDGLVIDFKLGIYYGDGRTATHEIGHYMGLQHTWGSNPPSCSNDDGFSDTPTNSSENYGCNFNANTCSGGDVDQIENYMSYSDCQNMFSLEQAAYMNSVLTNTRSSLLSSTGCEPTASPVVDFTSNKTTVQAGGTVLFTDLSSGIPNTWSWNFGGGGTPNTSTNKNPAIQFNTIGTYTVSLTATNTLGSDSETKNAYITVTAPSGCDTINWAFLLDTSLYTYTCGPTCGYVIGSNEYDDQAKAQKFSVSEYAPNTHVTGGLFYFGYAYKASGSNAQIIFKVWDSDGTAGAPGTVLGADTVDLADIVSDVQGNYLTQILFNSPVNVTNDFYFGFEMLNFDLWTGGTRDSLSLIQTLDGVMAGSNVWEYAERGSGYNWYDFSSTSSWNMTTTMFATPYMTDQPPTASFTASPASGCDGLTVNFDASASNNVLGYLWDFDGDGFYDALDTIDGQISNNYDTTGTFDVTLLTIGACSGQSKSTQSNLITINAKPSLSANATNTSCGTCNGTASVTVSGASTPYTYQWNDLSTTSSISSLCAGSFQVTVTDANGCSDLVGVNISDGASMSISTSATNAACGNTDGTATANGSGGTRPYTYLWDDPLAQTDSMATGLNSGTYNVTITDSSSCTIETDFFSAAVVSSSGGVSASISSSTDPSSCGTSDGTATASASGGTTPYTYSWSNSATTSTITGLSGGTYTVTITDANSCTDNVSVTLTSPSTPSVSITGTDPSCNGDTDGAATATGSGGTGTLSYSWNTTPVQNTATATGLSGGIVYTVTVTDGGGCTNTESITLTDPAAIVLSISTTDASCGNSDGEAAVTVSSGGSAPYSYLWDDPSAQTTSTANNLAAGSYSVIVTDANGCSENSSANVSNTGAPTVNITGSTLSCNGDNNGTATVSANGGAAPYTYSWNTSPVQTNTIATGLSGGTYTATVTDALGCIVLANATVSEPDALVISSNTTTTQGVCDGTATATPTGGTGTYTYLWNDSLAQTTATATGLCIGSYTITVTDANGCSESSTVTVVDFTGVKELTNDLTFKIYPNPTSGDISVEMEFEYMGNLEITVYNAIGKQVLNKELDNILNMSYTIDFKDKSGGIYYIHLRSDKQIFIEKIILVK